MSYRNGLHVEFFRNQNRFGYCMRVADVTTNPCGYTAKIMKPEFVEVNLNERLPEESSLNFSHQDLQELADGLWDMGFRPKNSAHAEILELTKHHLSDLRSLLPLAVKPHVMVCK